MTEGPSLGSVRVGAEMAIEAAVICSTDGARQPGSKTAGSRADDDRSPLLAMYVFPSGCFQEVRTAGAIVPAADHIQLLPSSQE